jgi:ADP-heptose:LPS heptosyltransferase
MSAPTASGVDDPDPGWAALSDLTVVRGGALGDFVVTLPALRALARPGRRLRLVGNTAARVLASGVLAEVDSLDDARWAGLFEDRVPLPSFRGGAVVLLKRHAEVAARLRGADWRPVLGAPPYPPPESDAHVGEHLLQAVAPAAVRPDTRPSSTNWRGPSATPVTRPGIGRSPDTGSAPTVRPATVRRLIDVPASARRAAAAFLHRLGVGTPYAVVHPGSGSPRKNWPAERFAEVARRVEAAGPRPLVLVGPADETAAAPLAGTAGWPALTGLRLEELVGLLDGAALYVGNDSGVSHLAGAVGAPTVAVFGPTRALRWRPLGPRVVTVEPTARCGLCAAAEETPAPCRCIERVEVEAVVAAVRSLAVAQAERSDRSAS